MYLALIWLEFTVVWQTLTVQVTQNCLSPQQRTPRQMNSNNWPSLIHNHQCQWMTSWWCRPLESKHLIWWDHLWFDVPDAHRRSMDALICTCIQFHCHMLTAQCMQGLCLYTKVPPTTDVSMLVSQITEIQYRLSHSCTTVTDSISMTELPNSDRPPFQLSVTGGKMRNISCTSIFCKHVIHAELAALRVS